MIYKDRNGEKQTILIDPAGWGFYWDAIDIRKLSSLDDMI